MKNLMRMISLVLTLTMCMALCVTAFASESEPLPLADTQYNSAPKRYYGTGNCSYTAYSTLYAGSGRYRASAWIQTINGQNVPAGYMGANGRVLSPSGRLLRETGMLYNTVSYYFVVATMNNSVYSGDGAYSQGEIEYFNGDHFDSDELYKTETVPASRGLLEEQLQDGKYPVNRNGKTYGSILSKETTGYEPSLIAALGTEGQEGYVRREDLQGPEIRTPEEAVAYMQTRPESYTIPLYDLQEKVIGEFEIGGAMDISGCTLEEAKTLAAAGSSAAHLTGQPMLVNGGYPRNSRGQTYGDHLMAQELGYGADLQAALGTEGQEGYVKREDLHGPKIRTPEEAVAYMKTRPDSWKIPLYDFQGNVIGEFEIGDAMKISGCTLEEAEALAASGNVCR